MAASVQFRPQNRNLGMVMREVDEDLAIFLGMRNGEMEGTENLIDSDEIDDSTEPKADGLLEPNVLQPEIVDYDFLNLEIDRNDYDWLYMQPDSSLLPSVELGVQDSSGNQTDISNGEGVSLKSELDASNHAESFVAANRKTTLSGDQKQTPRAATPTGRSALLAKSKPSRASTPTSKATLTSSKPTATQARSSTPVRAAPRSSTPVGRPSLPVSSKTASRPATPTRKLANPLTTSGVFGTDRSSSGRKTGSTMLKNPASRGTSPTARSRPSKPSEMLSLSHDAPENPKTLMPRRPASASRGRPNASATNLSFSNGKPRQKSCSPAKVRAPGSIGYKNGSMMLSRSRGHDNSGDDVNPVLMGTKMVERVVNMRKLAPPRQEEYVSQDNPKKSSQDNSGFGRSLSKKSLDMAIRHMDIRRTIPDNLRPIATGSLSSSSTKSSTVGVTESPSTSSSDSSKSSISINSRFLDGNEMYDCFSCDSKTRLPPASETGLVHVRNAEYNPQR